MKALCIGHTSIDAACMKCGDYGTFVGEKTIVV